MTRWNLDPQYSYILAEPFIFRHAANELANPTELGVAFLSNCKESVEFTPLKFENANSIVFPAISDVGNFKSATARILPILLKPARGSSMCRSVQLVRISYDSEVNMQVIWEGQIEATLISMNFIANLSHAALLTRSRNGNTDQRHGEINISVVSFEDRAMKTWKLLSYKQAKDSMVNQLGASIKLHFIGERIALRLKHCAQCELGMKKNADPSIYFELFTGGSFSQYVCTGCAYQTGGSRWIPMRNSDLYSIQIDNINLFDSEPEVLTLCYKNTSDEHSIGPYFYIYTHFLSLNDMGTARRFSDSVMLDAISNEAVEYIPKAASRVSEVIVRDGLMFLRMYLDQSELYQNSINECLMNEKG